MKAFLIGLLAWSASAWLATINTLPYLAPAITLLGWGGGMICTLGAFLFAFELFIRDAEKSVDKLNRVSDKLEKYPKRKVDVEVPA